MKKIKFTAEEDAKLLYLVKQFESSQYSRQAWKLVSHYMMNKTSRQCRERYQTYLNPNVNNTKWTFGEDALLLDLFKRFGPNWRIMTQFFSGRSNVCIKNRFSYLKRHDPVLNKMSQNIKLSNFGLNSSSKNELDCFIQNKELLGNYQLEDPNNLKMKTGKLVEEKCEIQKEEKEIDNKLRNEKKEELDNENNGNAIIDYFAEFVCLDDFPDEQYRTFNPVGVTENIL
ncbi:Myb-like DNA-binding domain containing protein [Tritrichomonas foetus]|uniref:Myb-like DNA-binding domain containing protein n=1 Tax=Tritrichomonas foetus TaxID=1144522 RepID=A0A1J4JUS7_9EUKA|nr:Myb-like DNA-binding domain containing protein [Tritrichomonas foetus]|eukprot:OHT02755.1 Myb-like DNA-binding domain containing protein [Tritrichomonas foetus]